MRIFKTFNPFFMLAVGKFLQAKPVDVVVEHKTTWGIHLNSTTSVMYEVVSMGEEVKGFKLNDKLILGPSYRGEEVKIDGQIYFFFNSDIVLGVY